LITPLDGAGATLRTLFRKTINEEPVAQTGAKHP
jgi:hypothetical protein